MWEYKYESESDQTTIYWDGEEQATINGKLSNWEGSMPVNEARDVIRDVIQGAGTPERIAMQYDLNYGFSEIQE